MLSSAFRDARKLSSPARVTRTYRRALPPRSPVDSPIHDASIPFYVSDGMISEDFQDKVLDFELKAIGTDKRISRDVVFDFSIMKSLAAK